VHRGYVWIWRKISDSGILQNHKLTAFWIWCLIKASHKTHKLMVGFKEVELQPGQFIFGRRTAAKELKMSEQSLRTCLNSCKTSSKLTLEVTHQYSIITICNWELYQGSQNGSNPQTNPRLTHDQPTTNHKQECNNGKNVKNVIKQLHGEFVLLTDEELIKLNDRYGKNVIQEQIDSMNSYAHQIGIKKFKGKYKSHYHTIINWMTRKNEPTGHVNSNENLRILDP